MIQLAARNGIPATSIYAEIHTKNGILGQRNILILVPGGPGNDHTTYDSPDYSITKALTPYVDIILFDPRGCGASEKSSPKYCTLEHYIDDIENIREYFKIPASQFILFGQSYGSIAALGYAIKYAEKLKKLILVGGAASYEWLEEAKENLLRIGNSEQKKWGEKLWAGKFTGLPNEVAEYYETMGPLYSYTFKPGQPTPSLTYNVEVFNLGFTQSLREFDYRPHLSKVTCPTLILWGEEDWISDKKQAVIIHKGITHSELVIYSQCSHLLWIDQWQKFVNKMLEYCN